MPPSRRRAKFRKAPRELCILRRRTKEVVREALQAEGHGPLDDRAASEKQSEPNWAMRAKERRRDLIGLILPLFCLDPICRVN